MRDDVTAFVEYPNGATGVFSNGSVADRAPSSMRSTGRRYPRAAVDAVG